VESFLPVRLPGDLRATRLPADEGGGRMDASIGAAQTDTINANALAADAVAEIQSGIATPDSIWAHVKALTVGKFLGLK
jgi:hypothetical protein